MKLAPYNGYIVVESSSLEEFVIAVQKAIAHGYIPQGGISVGGMCFYQAMVKPNL